MMVNSTTTDNPRRTEETYGLRRAIETIKEAVPIATAANDLGAELRPSGEELRGKGVCHGGGNETALLVVPDRRRWHCFRCNEGGDVIDLCRAVEGGELWEAVVSLAERYNVELPRRSERWHRRQDDKTRARDAATKHIAAVYQRRLTRLYSPLVLVGGESPEEELRELEELAAALWPVSLDMAGRRVSGA
jgi:DNA primase